MKMQQRDDMNRWLFAFQKSVARVLTSIIERRSQQIAGALPEGTAGEENGDFTRNTSFARMESTTTRAYTDEDVPAAYHGTTTTTTTATDGMAGAGAGPIGGGGGLSINAPVEDDIASQPRPLSSTSSIFSGGTPRFSGTPVSRLNSGASTHSFGFGSMSLAEESSHVFGLSDSLLSLSQKNNYVPPTKSNAGALNMASSYTSSQSNQSGNGGGAGFAQTGSSSFLSSSPAIPISTSVGAAVSAGSGTIALARKQSAGIGDVRSHDELDDSYDTADCASEAQYMAKMSSSFKDDAASAIGILQYSEEISSRIVHKEQGLVGGDGEGGGGGFVGSPARGGRSRTSSASSNDVSSPGRSSIGGQSPNDMGFFGDLDGFDEEEATSGAAPNAGSRSRSNSLHTKKQQSHQPSPPQPLVIHTTIMTPNRRPSNTSVRSNGSANSPRAVGSLADQIKNMNMGSSGANNNGDSGQAVTKSPRDTLGSPRSRPVRLTTLQCGSCSVLGQRKSNEDRFVCIADIYANTAGASSAGATTGGSPGDGAGGASSSKDAPPTAALAGSLGGASVFRGTAPAAAASSRGSTLGGTTANKSLLKASAGAAPAVTTRIGADGAYSYYGVYDGHAGSQVAEYVNTQLHTKIVNNKHFKSDIEVAITESCIAIDKEVLVSESALVCSFFF